MVLDFSERLGIEPATAVGVEDSPTGVRAIKAAEHKLDNGPWDYLRGAAETETTALGAAFLAGLCKILGLLRVQDVRIRVRNDGHFQRNGLTEFIAQNGVEGNADDKNAVHQRCQEKHRRQSVGDRQGLESHVVDQTVIGKNMVNRLVGPSLYSF